MKRVLRYVVAVVAVLFLLPALQSLGGTHGATTNSWIVERAGPSSILYVNPSSIPANTTVTVRPPTTIPTNVQPVVVTMAHDYITPAQPHTMYMNVNLPSTPWESVILNYTGTVLGVVYDTEATLSVNNVTVYRSVNPENGFYTVIDNLTQYEPLFHGVVNLSFVFPDAAVDGEYISNVTLYLYPGASPEGLPNMIVPVISADNGLFIGNSDNYTIPMTVPSNATAAVLQVWLVGNSFDESWYADEPSYRSLEIWSGGDMVANILPYYKVASGELDLFAWRPLMAPYEVNMIPYNVNVTAALGILEHNTNITLVIPNVSPLGAFWKVRITLLVWTSGNAEGAKLLSYGESSSSVLSTDVYMPNAGTSANGGNVSTPEYFFQDVSVDYHYTSEIMLTNGTIIASKQTSEVSYMNQYSINLVWENWTAYQLTVSRMTTTYNEPGLHATYIDVKTGYYPFTADTGFSFTITQTTNGGFPEYGPFASYLNGTYIAWDVYNTYTNISIHGLTESATYTSNSVFIENGVFAGIIELTSPVAGIITSITTITSVTMKAYLGLQEQLVNGRMVITGGYQHVIEAISDDPSGPWYFGNITLDMVYTF